MTPSAGPHRPFVPLDVVDIRSALQTRQHHRFSATLERDAFTALAIEMAANPYNILQKLVEIAIELCCAHTSAVTLLEGDVVRWEAVAGVFAAARGGTMPRNQSPCSVCIARDAPQLMHLADRCFPALPAEPRFVETLLVPFHANGKPIGAVWIVTHTEDRTFDMEDERVLCRLSDFVSAGWQLLQKSEALAEANLRKDRFLSMFAHELGNPLAAILTETAVLRTHLAHDEDATEGLDAINRQGRHIMRLADDLRDVVSTVSGKLRLEFQSVDLRTVVADTLRTVRSQIENRQHTLEVSLGEAPIPIQADPVRIAQLVANLVDNAAKYTPTGGHISVALTADDNEASIVVRDTGIGIAPEWVSRVFEPYIQMEETSSATGLGLGLAVVKSIAELHGGVVAIESGGPESGSCFTVRLPRFSTLGSQLNMTQAPRDHERREVVRFGERVAGPRRRHVSTR